MSLLQHYFVCNCLYSDSRRLVKRVMLIHSESHAVCLKQKFSSAIMDVRQSLAMSKGSSVSSVPPLSEHRTLLYNTIKTELENSITSLQVRVCKYVVIMDDSIAVCSYDRSSLCSSIPVIDQWLPSSMADQAS